MNAKSHVGIGHEVCPICGTKHNEAVLLDTRLRKTLTRDMITGISLCPEHDALREEYLALVEVSNKPTNGNSLTPHDAIRTGNIAHVKRDAADRIFSANLPHTLSHVYVGIGVISSLQKMQEQA